MESRCFQWTLSQYDHRNPSVFKTSPFFTIRHWNFHTLFFHFWIVAFLRSFTWNSYILVIAVAVAMYKLWVRPCWPFIWTTNCTFFTSMSCSCVVNMFHMYQSPLRNLAVLLQPITLALMHINSYKELCEIFLRFLRMKNTKVQIQYSTRNLAWLLNRYTNFLFPSLRKHYPFKTTEQLLNNYFYSMRKFSINYISNIQEVEIFSNKAALFNMRHNARPRDKFYLLQDI